MTQLAILNKWLLRSALFLCLHFLTIGLPSVVWAKSQQTHQCISDFQTEIEIENKQHRELYRQIDPEGFNSFIEANSNRFYRASENSPLIIMIHGFMGSPYEMQKIALSARKSGYHVANLLIPGFGGTAEIANQYSYKIWQKWLLAKLNQSLDCFPEVHLVGFSTGGLLIYDYLTNRGVHDKIQTATLISPFFKATGSFSYLIARGISLLLDKVSNETVYRWTRLPDLKVMFAEPVYYLQEVPLKSARQIMTLGELNIAKIPKKIKNKNFRLMTLLSQQDMVVDIPTSKALVLAWFPSSQVIEFSGRPRPPHHLMSFAVSPVAKEVRSLTLSHIRGK